MNKNKTTKRALISSVIALMLCISMLVGTTYAWFTDVATTGMNTIQSGTLDVALVDEQGNNIEGQKLNFKKADGAKETEAVLWEPGVTYELENFQIVNNGNLALKYKLAINGVEGDAKLLDVIEWTVSIGNSKNINLDTFEGHLTAGQKSSLVTVTGHMDESAGNEYQNLTVNGVSITVYATQDTVEYDSYTNQYDATAENASVWDGTIPESKPDTLVIDATTKTITVKDASALVYLNTLANSDWSDLVSGVNAYYYHWNWTVNLDRDIDLVNIPIAPITMYWGTFNGNGYTISNVKIEVAADETASDKIGLFNGAATYKNLTIDTITVEAPNSEYVGALVGSNNAPITNVTVKNSTIVGKKFVGGIVGYCASDITDCKVINSSVSIPATSTEKTVGGIVGYLITDGKDSTSMSEATGNLVENTTVAGTYNVGGIVGHLQGATAAAVVDSNTVRDSALVYYTVPVSPSSGEGVYADVFVARRVDTITIGTKNVSENNTIITGKISSGRIEYTGNRYQIAADFSAIGVKSLAVKVLDQDGKVLTTITPEGYTIPADGKIGDPTDKSQSSFTTICAAVTGNSSSWQNTSFVPSKTAVPTTMVLVVNGQEVSTTGISQNSYPNGKTWAEVVDATVTNVSKPADLATAIDEGKSYLELGEGEYTIPTAAAGKTLTISGTKDTVIDIQKTDTSAGGSNMTFEGVTIQGQTSGNYAGWGNEANVHFVDCTIEGKINLYGKQASFTNCTFNNKNDYAIWTWGGEDVDFIGCTFNSGGKALLVYGEYRTADITITDCVFNDDDTLNTDKAAIEIGSDRATDNYNIKINNITVNGFTVNPAGISTGTNIWANKNSMGTDRLNVVIDGVDVY